MNPKAAVYFVLKLLYILKIYICSLLKNVQNDVPIDIFSQIRLRSGERGGPKII
jgi:hypothetical protein